MRSHVRSFKSNGQVRGSVDVVCQQFLWLSPFRDLNGNRKRQEGLGVKRLGVWLLEDQGNVWRRIWCGGGPQQARLKNAEWWWCIYAWVRKCGGESWFNSCPPLPTKHPLYLPLPHRPHYQAPCSSCQFLSWPPPSSMWAWRMWAVIIINIC